MMRWMWLLWAVACAVGVEVWAVPPVDLPPLHLEHRALLDQEDAYYLLWTPREKDIVFEIQVATQGYVGLGFSPNGGMKGADIVLGWVDQQGRVILHDRHGEGKWMPPVDDTQDVELLGGYQNDTHTVLRFSRPWTTCDDQQDFPLSGDTTRVIWAYGLEDPPDADTVRIHRRRGTKSLYLKEPRFSLPVFTDDVMTWDIHAPNISVPGDLTTLYWCKLFRRPPLRRKTHFIGYQPVIETRNLRHVHHMLLYECHIPESKRNYEKWLQVKGAQCYSANMPISWNRCTSPVLAWAVGSEGEIFPEHVGLPLGEQHGGADYFMLEIHYDNPTLREGIVDKSGVRLYYTEKLRQHEMGLLSIGHTVTPNQIIPPARRWNTIGVCPDYCLRQGLPEGGVKVLQAVLHAHLLAVNITIKQIRNGRELPAKFRDMNYDFNYQQVRILEEEMTLLPGDSLINQCDYDSSSRTKPTLGGFSVEEEMCQSFLFYYPRVQLSQCTSTPTLSTLLTALGVNEVSGTGVFEVDEEKEKKAVFKMLAEGDKQTPKEINLYESFRKLVVTSPAVMRNTTVYDIMFNDATWLDEEKMALLQQQVLYGPQSLICQKRDNELLQGVPETCEYPSYVAIQHMAPQCVSPQDSPPVAPQAVDREAYAVGSPDDHRELVTSSPTAGLTGHSDKVEPQRAAAVQVALSATLCVLCFLLHSLQ